MEPQGDLAQRSGDRDVTVTQYESSDRIPPVLWTFIFGILNKQEWKRVARWLSIDPMCQVLC